MTADSTPPHASVPDPSEGKPQRRRRTRRRSSSNPSQRRRRGGAGTATSSHSRDDQKGARGAERATAASQRRDETVSLPLVRHPEGGTPPLVSSVQGVLEWCRKVVEGEHIAVDVERASSFRYSAKAYLVQVKTESAGILLLDPLAFSLPETFSAIMNTHPWVLHAARQDLPSLAMLELYPAELFDTEVAARLLGLPRVGLGTVAEELLGIRLAKEHSAANWSKRPLPADWLDYAALDVEYLEPLRLRLQSMLKDANKDEWACQEFRFESGFSSLPDEDEPWRSLHGIGQLRSPKQLAVARALWEHRDSIARSADIAPFMVIRDKYIIAMVKAMNTGRADFEKAMPRAMKHRDVWWRIARDARALPAAHLPDKNKPNSIPHHKMWTRKHPEASEAYSALREGLLARADELNMPVENLISPGHARHYVWHLLGPESNGGEVESTPEIERILREAGARPWQAHEVAPIVREKLA